MTGPELSWRLAAVDPRRMKTLALLLDDPNPIHLDRGAAAELGVAEREVNQGPSTMAMIYDLFEAEHPGMRVEKLEIRLTGSVLAEQEVVVTATPVAATGPRVAFDVGVSADGTQVIRGRAVLIPRGAS